MEWTIEKLQEIMEKNNGNLDLSFRDISALPDNLTVGGYLDLENCTGITALPDNLTVGGYLDLRGTGITALPDNLTVGGDLELPDGFPNERAARKKVNTLLAGDYVPGRYLYADNMLTHVRTVRQVGAYTLYIGKIKGKNVVSDGTHYAHCDKLRDGIADLLFKTTADRGAEQYKTLTLDSEVKTADAIAMYRVITGACRQGTQRFIDSLGELKEAYTVREIVELTKGQYGADKFKQFFGEG